LLPVSVPSSPKFQLNVYGETPPVAVAVKETRTPGEGSEGE
jgi:hypothetical protein